MSVKNVHAFRPLLPAGAAFYRRKYLQHVDVFLLQQNETHELNRDLFGIDIEYLSSSSLPDTPRLRKRDIKILLRYFFKAIQYMQNAQSLALLHFDSASKRLGKVTDIPDMSRKRETSPSTVPYRTRQRSRNSPEDDH